MTTPSQPVPSPSPPGSVSPVTGLLTAVLAASPSTVVIAVDPELQILFVSGGAILARHGHSAEAMVGRHVSDLVPAPLFDELLPLYRAALAGERRAIDVASSDRTRHYRVEAGPIHSGTAIVGAVTVSRDVTHEREVEEHADEQIRLAHERFERAFEEAPIGMALVRLDGRFLQVNHALCEITGRSVDELLAVDFQSITHPDDVDIDEALAAELAAGTRDHYRLDKRYLRPDGTEVPVSLHGSIVRYADGSPAYFIAQVVDISHRIHTERALSDERDFLSALLESLDVGVVACDATGRLTLFNATAATVHGQAEPVSADEWPERYRLHHPSGRALLPDEVPLKRALVGEHVRDAEVLVHGQDGTSALMSVNAQTIRSRDGRALGAVLVQHDITRRRELEDALRTAEVRWRDAFAHGPVGMAIVALDHAQRPIRSANRALAALLGMTTHEIEGHPLSSLAWSNDDAAAADDLIARVAEDGATGRQGELRLRHADGRTVWVHVTVTATPDPDAGAAAIVHLNDVSERKGYEARLEHLADHDALTGFFNRRRFDEELERAVSAERRHGRAGALLLMDLDQFKYVNDTYGHLAGDEVIRHAGGVLRGRLRDTDVLARIGGDEFAIILPETGETEAQQVAGELLDELRAQPPLMDTGQTLALTASIGIVAITDSWRLTPGELLMEADIAMYDAKDAGRNQIALAAPGRHTHAKMKSRLTWAERIRSALEDDRFVLHAQPIVLTDDGSVDRYELLVRLRDTDDRLIAPGRFLYIAERFGQIQEIDQWVMHRTTELLAQRPDEDFAMNLSGASIGDARTVALLAELLGDANVDPGRLTIEITETAAIRSIDVARGFAQQLSDLGCLLALDDFGAGFGSFFYLKHLPFTCVKIDGEFIRGMATSQSDRLTVEAIVRIAQGLGKRTTAEYVADERTLQVVRALGVDFAQGFHVGRPGPLPEPGVPPSASRSVPRDPAG